MSAEACQDDTSRFYVQRLHGSEGHAVIDRQLGALVAVADEPAAKGCAAALNAATTPGLTEGDRNDAFKQVHPDLAWRVIQHLAALLRQQS